MKFTDVVGDSTINPVHLKTLLEKWFSPEDIISVIGIPVNGRRDVLSFAEKAHTLHEYDENNIFDLCYMSDTSQKFNMYFSVNPLIEDHNVSLQSRGSKEDVQKINGTFVDLDVKDGSFESKSQIKEFLNNIPLKPTIIIDNGSLGGVHAYWRLIDEDTPVLPTPEDEKLLIRWWAYISSLTNAKVDKLIDITRIMRLPSAIYWPKDEDGVLDTVKIVKADGPRYSLNELVEASEGAYHAYEEKRRQTRQRIIKAPYEWNSVVDSLDVPDMANWKLKDHQKRWAYASADVQINKHYSWYDILEPCGWTHNRELSDGSNEWTRPGKRGERSATTDYMRDDFVVSDAMSLLTSSEETNLVDLRDLGIPLTKKQVMLRLWFNDDVSAMVDHILSEVYNLKRS